VGLTEFADRVELTVSDTGVGIPDEERPRLFERFHRVEGTRARTHEGSGIGLALVHDLARSHGGAVRVESAIGEGSQFIVTLPRVVDRWPADKLVGAAAEAAVSPSGHAFVAEAMRWVGDEAGLTLPADRKRAAHASRVLIADDNADLREYITRLLQDLCDVTAVGDGEQALAALSRREFDLLITDVMMPTVDGFELLRQIRS